MTTSHDDIELVLFPILPARCGGPPLPCMQFTLPDDKSLK